MENETTRIEMEWTDVPARWPLCFNTDCPKCGTCLHHLTTQALPPNITEGRAIFPTALSDEGCTHYHEAKHLRLACGFNSMLDNVRKKDVNVLRLRLQEAVGGKSAYYRCAKGQLWLTPDKQETVLQQFREMQYTENLAFDCYRMSWNFQ